MALHIGSEGSHQKTYKVDILNEDNSNKGNGKAEKPLEGQEDKSLSFWSKHTGSLIYFQRPPILISHFPRELAEKFLAMGFDEQYELHEEIMKEGQIGADMFLITEGVVSIFSKGINMANLEKGDVFGELILFRDQYRIASVRVEKPARLLRFSREILKDFFSAGTKEKYSIFT